MIAWKLLPASLKRVAKRYFQSNRYINKIVARRYGCEIINGEVPPELVKGWQDQMVALRQHAAFAPLLKEMHNGKPREDFIALAKAVRMTEIENPLIIEVGCGSGWNKEILTHLLKWPIRYIGLDYSPAMTTLGRQCYSDVPFVVGDAAALPFKDSACDILLSGTVLMHLMGYREAIQESRRVTQKWCIFHTVPLAQKRPTTVLRKIAYGSPVVEVILNEEEFSQLITANGLTLRHAFESIPHPYLKSVLNETVSVRTYLCEVT